MLQQVDKMALSIWFMLYRDTNEEEKKKKTETETENGIKNRQIEYYTQNIEWAHTSRAKYAYILRFQNTNSCFHDTEIESLTWGDGESAGWEKKGKLHRKVLIHYTLSWIR